CIARSNRARTATACPGVQSSGTEISMVMSPPGSLAQRATAAAAARNPQPQAAPGRRALPTAPRHGNIGRSGAILSPPSGTPKLAAGVAAAGRRRSAGGVQPADRRAVGGAPERFQLAVPGLAEQPGE